MEPVTAFDGWIRRGPLGPGYRGGVRAAAVARLVRRDRWPVRLWDVLRGIERMRDERLHQPRPESPTRTQPSLYLSATDVDGSVIVNRIKRGG